MGKEGERQERKKQVGVFNDRSVIMRYQFPNQSNMLGILVTVRTENGWAVRFYFKSRKCTSPNPGIDERFSADFINVCSFQSV